MSENLIVVNDSQVLVDSLDGMGVEKFYSLIIYENKQLIPKYYKEEAAEYEGKPLTDWLEFIDDYGLVSEILGEESIYNNKTLTFDGLPFKQVSEDIEYSGEEGHNTRSIVYQIGERFFKAEFAYSSWEGYDIDDTILNEVVRKKIEIEVWANVNE